MDVMGFSADEQLNFFRIVAAILHLGNVKPTADKEDQAQINDISVAEKVCHVLGIPVAEFIKSLCKPVIKAGKDWVASARTVEQVLYSTEALSRTLYERSFGKLVERINAAIDTPKAKSNFIGVLDIAGFEIFEVCYDILFWELIDF